MFPGLPEHLYESMSARIKTFTRGNRRISPNSNAAKELVKMILQEAFRYQNIYSQISIHQRTGSDIGIGSGNLTPQAYLHLNSLRMARRILAPAINDMLTKGSDKLSSTELDDLVTKGILKKDGNSYSFNLDNINSEEDLLRRMSDNNITGETASKILLLYRRASQLTLQVTDELYYANATQQSSGRSAYTFTSFNFASYARILNRRAENGRDYVFGSAQREQRFTLSNIDDIRLLRDTQRNFGFLDNGQKINIRINGANYQIKKGSDGKVHVYDAAGRKLTDAKIKQLAETQISSTNTHNEDNRVNEVSICSNKVKDMALRAIRTAAPGTRFKFTVNNISYEVVAGDPESISRFERALDSIASKTVENGGLPETSEYDDEQLRTITNRLNIVSSSDTTYDQLTQDAHAINTSLDISEHESTGVADYSMTIMGNFSYSPEQEQHDCRFLINNTNQQANDQFINFIYDSFNPEVENTPGSGSTSQPSLGNPTQYPPDTNATVFNGPLGSGRHLSIGTQALWQSIRLDWFNVNVYYPGSQTPIPKDRIRDIRVHFEHYDEFYENQPVSAKVMIGDQWYDLMVQRNQPQT
jgi:hypothetical protein